MIPKLGFPCIGLLLIVAGMSLASGQERMRCAMEPARLRIEMPLRGFDRLPDEEGAGSCEEAAAKKWRRKPSGRVDLLVHAEGPSGSGRYWDLAVAIAKKTEKEPRRGVCLRTSTVGWRTLGAFRNSPLPWLDDIDADGRAELIIWESFPLTSEPSAAEFGLVAWAYRPDTENSLSIDWTASRRLAGEVALAYRKPLPGSYSDDLRAKAAAALELFAGGRCTIRGEQRR